MLTTTRLAILACALFTTAALAQSPKSCAPTPDGANPCPVVLRKPPVGPLSLMAQIGSAVFHDAALSGNGKLACASCHDLAHHYGPISAASVFLGGEKLDRQGRRAVPSLDYLERQPNFNIGPDNPVSEEAPPPITAAAAGTGHATKSATNTASSATNLVPQGGLFWDGRADTFQAQALGPLYDPVEMGSTPDHVAERVTHAPYAPQLRQLLGVDAHVDPRLMVSEAMFALARYETEQRSFHAYSSKFDAWLEGHARFTPQERQGYLLFNDPAKGNCAACHVDTVSADHLPPLFTDHQYEALGVPRNPEILATHDPQYYDLGVCDREPGKREELAPYCGMFATPTLRNAATRHVFFHNGVFHSLDQVMDFYVERDIAPEKFYPRGPDGHVQAYNDLPARYRANLDTADAPFDRKPGDKPALTPEERQAVIAFLKTLTDR